MTILCLQIAPLLRSIRSAVEFQLGTTAMERGHAVLHLLAAMIGIVMKPLTQIGAFVLSQFFIIVPAVTFALLGVLSYFWPAQVLTSASLDFGLFVVFTLIGASCLSSFRAAIILVLLLADMLLNARPLFVLAFQFAQTGFALAAIAIGIPFALAKVSEWFSFTASGTRFHLFVLAIATEQLFVAARALLHIASWVMVAAALHAAIMASNIMPFALFRAVRDKVVNLSLQFDCAVRAGACFQHVALALWADSAVDSRIDHGRLSFHNAVR